MSEPKVQEEDVATIPLWVFFASGSKWMGGFVCGCLGLFCSEMFTSEPMWISSVTAIATFVGWSTGTYLDINTYINERFSK